MRIASTLLPEFDHEMANTRRSLERIPDEQLDWRPHDRSWTLRELATHLANLPRWTVLTLLDPSFDVDPVDGQPQREPAVHSTAEALARFDQNVAAARGALVECDDATLLATWSLLRGGEPIFTLPRVAVLRGFVMNHMIHHRGQLSVYLRLVDAPVPALYGPSADEP